MSKSDAFKRGEEVATQHHEAGTPFLDWLSPGDLQDSVDFHAGYGSRVHELTGATTWPIPEPE